MEPVTKSLVEGAVRSDLFSREAAEQISAATRHARDEGEFLAFPLRRVDSGPYEHDLQVVKSGEMLFMLLHCGQTRP